MAAYVILIDISILLFLAFFFAFFTQQAFNVVFRGYAPFIPSKKKTIKNILDNLELEENCKIHELGCGRAGFLRAARQRFPLAELIGYENSSVLFWQAKIQNWLSKSHLNIQRKNLFQVDLSDSDLVYCFLNPGMMAKLESKFEKELKPGAQILSFQYKIPGFTPTNILQGDKISEKIYFYKI